MPPQKDTRQIVEKTYDVLYDQLAPTNDYLPEAMRMQKADVDDVF